MDLTEDSCHFGCLEQVFRCVELVNGLLKLKFGQLIRHHGLTRSLPLPLSTRGDFRRESHVHHARVELDLVIGVYNLFLL